MTGVEPTSSRRRPTSMRILKAAAAVILLAATVAGCGGSDKPAAKAGTNAPPSTAPATATVRGRLLAVGGPAPGTARPVAGTVTFTGPNGSTTKTQVDKTGRFEIGLYPGTYRIRGSSPSFNDGAPCATDPATTRLTAGTTVTADVYCQMR